MRQLLCPRIVGRDDELRVIATALESARDGNGEAIFLLGEAGVGKSRLTREAERMALALGMRTLRGRGVESGAGGAGAYGPIAEALLATLRRDGLPEARPELLPFQPILGRLIPDWREVGAAPVEESLVLLGEAVLRLLKVLASSGSWGGCLLVLEDLHWADTETLAVLDYLIANTAGEPLVLLATSRPDRSCGALAMARSLRAQRVGTVLELDRLSPDAVREMGSACLGNAPVPDAVDRLLGASADGLPLLVEDLLAEWADAGALVQTDGGWHVRHVVRPVVPLSFGESVRRRQRQLGDDATRVLRLAALLGRHFDWKLLASASGLDDERVLELLRRAVDAQLLEADAGGFVFRHALTRDAVLQELLPAERSLQAARLLELLEARLPGPDDEWSDLAVALAEAAGDQLKAATLLLDSARDAFARGALATAEATLEHARSLAPATTSSGLRTDIDQVLLRVLSEAGKHERVFEVGQSLLKALSEGVAPPLQHAEVHLTMANAAVAGFDQPAASLHLDAARALQAHGLLEARIDALAAHVAIDELRLEDAAHLAGRALEAADRLGQSEVACEALVVLGRLARARDLDGAEAAFQRAYHLATAQQLAVWRSRALHELGTIDMFRDAAPDRLLEARSLALSSGALATVAWVDGELSALFNTRFEMDRSFEAAQSALDAGRRYRLRGVEAMALVFVAEFHAYRQDRLALARALDELKRVGGDDGFCRIAAGECRAISALLDEDRPRALRELDDAMETIRRTPLASPSPTAAMWTLLKTVEDPPAAAEARAELAASWSIVNLTNRGYLAYAEAIDLGHRGQRSQAGASLAEGDRMLAPAPWYFHYGRRLLAEAAVRDGWGEPVAWLTQAEAFFLQHAYQVSASACRSLLRKSGVSTSRPRAHPGVPQPFRGQGVTEREYEVLSVLAEGVSNRDIAARLYLSPKTVEKHVASLMDKLEVRTRAQLATRASANLGNGAN